jgi:glutaredoxin
MSSEDESEICENTLPIIKKIATNKVIDLIGKLKSLKSFAINACPFIVFKVSKELNNCLIHDSRDCEQIYTRSNGKDVYTLVFDSDEGEYKFYKIGKRKGVLHKDDDFQKIVRQSDLAEVLEQTEGSCIHIPPNNTHFKTPSGFHTKTFLRLADAIHSYNALDRISFWLQSHMINVQAVLVDNWSLSPIILQTQILLKKEIFFDCLSKHIDNDIEEAKKLIQKLVNRVTPGSTILIIVSVNASGSFSNKLLNLCRHFYPDYSFRIISIYQLPNINSSNDSALCQIKNKSITFFNESDCPYCKKGEVTHLIDSKYYYPKLDNESKINLKSKYIEAKNNNLIRESLDKLGSVEGVFCVHRDDPNDGITPRHHAYYVDVCPLIRCDNFVNELSVVMDNIVQSHIPAPDIVISPPHDAGKNLSNLICDHFGCNVIFTHNMNLEEKDKEVIKNASHICIIDDVLITGTRLNTFNRALREEIKPTFLKKVSYLIAVSRTESKKHYDSIRDALVSKHDWSAELYPVYQVYLPAWNEDDCPWCKELEIWSQFDSLFAPPEYYKKRIRQLNSRSNLGISNQPLARLDGIGDIYVGSSSPMAHSGSSEMVTLYNIAVALQMMRNDQDEKNRLERMLYRNNALNGGENGNFKRFSEPLIQACLLKNTKPNEWSSDIVSGINSLINSLHIRDTHIIILEILLFALRYSSNERIDVKTLTDVVEGYLNANDPIKELILQIGK